MNNEVNPRVMYCLDNIKIEKLSDRKLSVVIDIPVYIGDVKISSINLRIRYVEDFSNTNSACYFLAPNDASILKVSQRFGIKMKRIIVKFKPLDFKYKDKLYVISLIDRFILDDKKWSRDYLLKTLLD